MRLILNNRSNYDLKVQIGYNSYKISRGLNLDLENIQMNTVINVSLCAHSGTQLSMLEMWIYGGFLPSMTDTRIICNCSFKLNMGISDVLCIDIISNKATIGKRLYFYSVYPKANLKTDVSDLQFQIKNENRSKRAFYLTQLLFCSALPIITLLTLFLIKDFSFLLLALIFILVLLCTIPSFKKIINAIKNLNNSVATHELSLEESQKNPLDVVDSSINEGLSNNDFKKTEKLVLKFLKSVIRWHIG